MRLHLKRRPATNPFARYRQRFERDLETLRAKPIAYFHIYAFATLRQLGANFELASTFLRWLEERGEGGLAPAAAQFATIAEISKSLMLKLARAVMHKKPLDFASFFALEEAWDRAMQDLMARYGG